jgi:hypothetical protein
MSRGIFPQTAGRPRLRRRIVGQFEKRPHSAAEAGIGSAGFVLGLKPTPPSNGSFPLYVEQVPFKLGYYRPAIEFAPAAERVYDPDL